jgi:DNA-binding CsgD family transcriptional regulator
MINAQILDQNNLYLWAKDKNYKYLYCNENYARAAGLDSPGQIVGMSDDNMPWRELADFFRQGDHDVFQGKIRVNVPETEIMVDRRADILVSESQLLDKNQRCIGLAGSFIDITGLNIIKKTGYYNAKKRRYYLGNELGNIWLTPREVEVLKNLLLGYTVKHIGHLLKISHKTVEGYIENLRNKLNVTSKNEVISTAIRLGLTQLINLQN